MENNENFVEQAENVEQTTEETVVEQPKTFTQEELNDLMGKGKARTRAKVEKEFQRKYGDLIDVLKAGTGKESVEEITDTFKQFYAKKGIQVKKPTYTDKDLAVLAQHDADEIIRGGFEDVVEEADRLNAIGAENMTARDKAVFVALTNYIKDTETSRELSGIGVTEDVYNSKEFQEFAGKFSATTPIRDVYDIFQKTQPKKEVRTMGSMRSNVVEDNGVKDFYTREEAARFTLQDFNNNPELYKKVVESSYKWK